jgi:hypothetical protein
MIERKRQKKLDTPKPRLTAEKIAKGGELGSI